MDNNEEEDNDPDVGIGSVQGIQLGSSDNHDLDMMSDMPLLTTNVIKEAQAEKRHNPKMDASKGKGSSATRLGLMHLFLVVPAVLVLFS